MGPELEYFQAQNVLIVAFSWQRDTVHIMQGSISNGPSIGSAANLSSLSDGREGGYEIEGG